MINQEKNNELTPELARVLLWHESIVHWLLHEGQKSLYDSYNKCIDKIVVWNCSRRFGKSYTLCVIAIETCLKTPNALVKYCCAKQVDARGIIRPLIREIITSCPIELRPAYKTQERAYVFPNGSRIELSGLDGGRAESIRGGAANLCIVDEAGLVSDLEYILNSILLPTTLTTKGKIVLASTPPKTATHAFVTKFLTAAKINGNLTTKTVYENPLIDESELKKIIDEYGGEESIAFRREFLCEILVDDNYAVVPEFTTEVKAECIREWTKPPFFDAYVAMDLGIKDLTVVLFAYYDFKASKIIIEDEFVINGQKFNTQALAEGIKERERKIFVDPVTAEDRPPYMRVSDTSLTVINDLRQLHGLMFIPTRKDDADAALNNMKILIQNKKIIIHPKCKTLITHLEAAIWNKNKTSFDRSGDNGHFDAIDSLKYLVRNVQMQKNPYPAGYNAPSTENQFNYGKKSIPNASQWKSIFNIKK